MDITRKLAVLADAAKYDASCASSGAGGRKAGPGGLGSTTGSGICHSYTPDGRCVSLLKILLTNVCIFDCLYCVNRKSSDVVRARFTPEEVVGLTLDFYRRNYIEGLFLSSGIIRSPDYTMEQLVRVARSLREEHRFRGYVHLKTIPEADAALVEEAGRWADRLSINVELPSQSDLDRLAPDKKLVQIEGAMSRVGGRIAEARHGAKRRHVGSTPARPRAPRFAPAGQSTQMVVGATRATDLDVLGRASSLYRVQRLRRVYYSAFSPIPAASAYLPVKAPPLLREHRLYQADWLMRFYGFGVSEIVSPDLPTLELDVDPKLGWALRHREHFPVDVNRAPKDRLVRVPGLGVRNAGRIVASRRHRRVRLDDLRRLGVRLDLALPFLVTEDHRPTNLDHARLREKLRPDAFQTDLFHQAVDPTGDGCTSRPREALGPGGFAGGVVRRGDARDRQAERAHGLTHAMQIEALRAVTGEI